MKLSINNSPLIHDEIKELEENLKSLKTRYLSLTENIKKQVYWLGDKNEPRHTGDIMNAALSYFLRYSPYGYGGLISLSQGKEWKTDVILPYYVTYLDNFKDNSGTSPTYLAYIKDLHHVIDYKEAWLHAVNNHDSILSLPEFKKKYKGQKLLDLLTNDNDWSNTYKNKYADRIFVINCKELKVKDIVVVFPKSIKKEEYTFI